MSGWFKRIITSSCLKHFISNSSSEQKSPTNNGSSEDCRHPIEICHHCPFFSLIFLFEKELESNESYYRNNR